MSRSESAQGIRIQCLCIDSCDPARITSFWQSALGWRRTFAEDGVVVLEPPEGNPEDGVVPDLIFLKVPKGKFLVQELRRCQPTDVHTARYSYSRRSGLVDR